MSMRVSVILNRPPEEVFLKTAPHTVDDASVVIGKEGFPVLIVLNDPRILFFDKLYPVYQVNL